MLTNGKATIQAFYPPLRKPGFFRFLFSNGRNQIEPDWTKPVGRWIFFSRLLAVHSLSGIVSIAPPVQHLIMHELNVNSNWLNCGTGKLRPPQHGNYQWKTQKRHCHGALLCGATTAVSQRFLWRKRMNSHFRMIRTYREFSALPYDTLNK